MDRPRIVLGLGNPGPRYRRTRHNIGFRVIDEFAGLRGMRLRDDGEPGRIAWLAEGSWSDGRIVLAKPKTFMNRSGLAAAVLGREYQVAAGDFVVIHDDADLDLDRIRVRRSGGPGGHNGVGSVIEVLGTRAFPRIRIGVRGEQRPEGDLAGYVLEDFRPDEQQRVEAVVQRAAQALEVLLAQGTEVAMNRFNAPPTEREEDD